MTSSNEGNSSRNALTNPIRHRKRVHRTIAGKVIDPGDFDTDWKGIAMGPSPLGAKFTQEPRRPTEQADLHRSRQTLDDRRDLRSVQYFFSSNDSATLWSVSEIGFSRDPWPDSSLE